jgi:hypothetical protein
MDTIMNRRCVLLNLLVIMAVISAVTGVGDYDEHTYRQLASNDQPRPAGNVVLKYATDETKPPSSQPTSYYTPKPVYSTSTQTYPPSYATAKPYAPTTSQHYRVPLSYLTAGADLSTTPRSYATPTLPYYAEPSTDAYRPTQQAQYDSVTDQPYPSSSTHRIYSRQVRFK